MQYSLQAFIPYILLALLGYWILTDILDTFRHIVSWGEDSQSQCLDLKECPEAGVLGKITDYFRILFEVNTLIPGWSWLI